MPDGTVHALRALVILGLLLLPVGCGGGDGDSAGGSTGAPVLLAAGDIAECDGDGDEATARVLAREPEATIAPLGDLAYPHGTAEQFADCFGSSWGRFRDRMRPAAGNHDHATKDARGYGEYFGARAGGFDEYSYAYDLGTWRVVVLDSDCWRVGGCGPDDPQARWFRDQLRTEPARCTLAYWHRPPFSSGRYGDPENTDRVRPLWQIAVEQGVDVILTGHEHSYERFVPMGVDGRADPGGPRLFIVGTGGAAPRPYTRPRLATTAVRNDDTIGLLRLDLRPGGYGWRFLPANDGSLRDSGAGDCH